MPRFIHLNGPPGIGKSTVAQLYVDDHYGVLNLDIDRVRGLIGGWQEHFDEAGAIARPIAFGMAAAHLCAGRDVIMPQYLGRLSEIERFEAAAHDSGAEFRELVLMDTKERSLERFTRRGENDRTPWHRQVQEIVERGGGRRLLADMHDQLTQVLNARPGVNVISSVPGDIQQTYASVTAIIDATA